MHFLGKAKLSTTVINEKAFGERMRWLPFFAGVVGIVLLLPAAQAQWFYDSEEIQLRIETTGGATIIKESSRARVDHVTVNLSLFPRTDSSQKLTSLDVQPDPLQVGEDVIFRFGDVEEVSFSVEADITKQNRLYPVTEKIPFPLENVPEEVKRFTRPSEIIDSDSEPIVRVASELAEGRTDLYDVVFTIARWTKKNIDYNLSTLTAEVNQQASWVLYERQGVCDELTSLFIAMLRSLDVPARFVTGYAYTNSPLFQEDWGAHGWAEVYFPGTGWVPFDVTYGQYGWVDPTHVTLKRSLDPGEASTGYEWVGRDIDLKLSPLETSVVVQSHSGKAPPLLQARLEPLHEEVGFGSYNAIVARISNPQSFYVATSMYLSAPPELEFLSDREQNILLRPRSEKTVHWIFRVPEDLESGFRYTYPLGIQTSRNQTAESLFRSASREPVFSLAEIDGEVSQQQDEQEKTYSSSVSLSCDAPSSVRVGENATFVCTVGNTGNQFLKNLDVCFGRECQEIELGITQEKHVNLSLVGLPPGRHEQQVTVSNSAVSKALMIQTEVLDEPAVAISIEGPQAVEYEDQFTMVFSLNRTSYSLPQDLQIGLRANRQEWEWTMDRLHETQSFEVPLEGKHLAAGVNRIIVTVAVKDQNETIHRMNTYGDIALENVTVSQRVKLAGMNTLRAAGEADPLMTGIVGGVVIIVFFSILITVFRKD